jgi:hypothetical protein
LHSTTGEELVKTINKLMQGPKVPGSLKLQQVKYPGRNFTPYFKDEDGCWVGQRIASKTTCTYSGDNPIWQKYKEPSVKVVKWLWRDPANNCITITLYANEIGKYTEKLEWSRTECEVKS